MSLYLYLIFRPSNGYKVDISSSSSCLCIRIVSSVHPTDTNYAPFLPLRLSVSVSSLRTILRIHSRHFLFLFLFVSLYLYLIFRPSNGYKVDISSSSSCFCIRIVSSVHPTDTNYAPFLPLRVSVSNRLFRSFYGYKAGAFPSSSSLCICIVFSDHPTDTKQTPSLPLCLSVSVSSFRPSYGYKVGPSSSSSCLCIVSFLQSILQIQRRHLPFLFVSLHPYRLFRSFYRYKDGTFPSSSSLCIRIVFSNHLTDPKQAPSLPLCLSVSVSSLQTILRIQSRHFIFIFVSLYRYRCLRSFYAYKADISSSSSSLCIGIVS